MAKLVDLSGEWAAAIGKAFVAFGSIEHTTVVCLRQIPKDQFRRFAKGLNLTPRVDLLLEILESYPVPECIELSEKLERVKALAKTRNLIAHNPLVLEFYEDGNGGYAYKEAIAAIHREGHKITLAEVQDFAAKSEQLAGDLIGISMKAFKALGVVARD